MRSELVQTNLRCNQNCTYCTARRAVDDVAWTQRPAVEARIGAALDAGAQRIVLSGGEPTLRADLPALVRAARARGAAAVALETNATIVDAAMARALAAAGLDEARVNLAVPSAALDAITRDPGGFAATLRGIDALLAAGVAVDVQAAVVRSTVSSGAPDATDATDAPDAPDATDATHAGGGLAALPAFLRARFGDGIRTLFLTVPVRAPDAEELLDYDRAGAAIRSVEEAARRAGLPLKLAPDSGPPPCVHGNEPRVAHLYALTRGASLRRDHEHLEPCERCAVRDRCPGIPREVLARFGAPAMVPVESDRARRRLSMISTLEEQVARELVTENRYRDPVEGDVVEAIIRVVFQCNQTCRFCFVSTHLPAAPDDAIEAAIRAAAARGQKITLSGGEPTLHRRIVEYVALAKSLSSVPVLMQTNAVRLADEALTRALAEAGLDEAFVSLHGATKEIADAVTHAPGTFDKTVQGIDHLVRHGVIVQLNFVICQANLHELPAWVELLADRWPTVYANVSFVAPSTDVVPRERALVPRYVEVMPVLAEAVARARSRGLAIGGFESMCGIPLCLVPDSLEPFFALSELPPGIDGGEFVKPPPCAGCALASRCHGLREGYLELHGDRELRAVTRS